MEKKCKISKIAVWGGLTNSCEKKRSKKQKKKGKIQASEAELQRIARRDKKTFFSDQCKEIEESNSMQVRKQQLELDMEQQAGSKWEKVYVEAVYCHPDI